MSDMDWVGLALHVIGSPLPGLKDRPKDGAASIHSYSVAGRGVLNQAVLNTGKHAGLPSTSIVYFV